MEHKGNRNNFIPFFVFLISLFGIVSVIILLVHVNRVSTDVKLNLLMLSLLYLMTNKWAVTLLSGAKFRPAIVFVLLSMLTNPLAVAVLVPLPGLLFMNFNNKKKWWEFFFTIGHLSLGIYAGGLVYQLLLPHHGFSLPSAYLAISLALIVHFFVNQFVAALIICYRKNNFFIKQCLLIRNDFNWTYTGIYLLSVQMLLIFKEYQYWGLIISVFLLTTIYQSVIYFSQYQVISKKAFTDALTGSENRAAWELFIEEMTSKTVSGSIMMVDLDNFKMLNDQYGHQFGDRMLKEFVQYIQNVLNRDHRIFRYGGDEFVIYIFHELHEYQTILEEVRDQIEYLNKLWADKNLKISISSGMTQVLADKEMSYLIKKVDQLMYKEKHLKKEETAYYTLK